MPDWRKLVQCRNRAEFLRTIAEEIELACYKETLTRVAESYDEHADLLERKLKAIPA